MSTIVTEVYDALIDAGASEEKARKAAAVIITDKNQLATRDDVLTIKNDIRILAWAIAAIAAVGGAGFGYVISLLNTVISKL